MMNILEEIQNCPVEWKELGEVAEVGTGNNNTNEQVENGKYPFYVRSKNIKTINTYLFDEEAIVIPGEGDIGKIFHYVKGKYGLHQRAYRIHITVDNIKTKFIYYYMHANFKSFITKKAVSATVSSIRKPMIEKFPIPIPPREIQEKIVQILDKFTDYVTELTSELTSRKKQYSFYRDKLLSFEDEVYQVEWKMLGEVCEIIRGNGLQKKDFVDEGVPCIHYGQIYTYYSSYVYKTKSFISFSLSEKLKKAQTGDIIVATTSENIEDVGKSVIWLGDGEVCIGGHSCIMKTKENSKYINYCMRSIFFQKQKEKQVVGTKVIELYPKNLSKIKIPIPPLEIQEKIVQVLDNFDTVCNDLNIGLPKEIELRQKQYEYWREQLLNFNK